MTLKLKGLEPFAWGGNRLCYVHPDDENLCVKVRRPDFTLEDLRKKKGFPKTLRPLSSFDDNLEEFRVLSKFESKYGEKAFRHIVKCYGFQETDMGSGLVSELIRDDNGEISNNIKQHVWREGVSSSFEAAFENFCKEWEELALPSRRLLIHNVMVQKSEGDEVKRLVVIDGLGYAGVLPEFVLPRSFFRSKAERKVEDLRKRLAVYIEECKAGKEPTYVGMNEDRTKIKL